MVDNLTNKTSALGFRVELELHGDEALEFMFSSLLPEPVQGQVIPMDLTEQLTKIRNDITEAKSHNQLAEAHLHSASEQFNTLLNITLGGTLEAGPQPSHQRLEGQEGPE